jgi:hypothetical protein
MTPRDLILVLNDGFLRGTISPKDAANRAFEAFSRVSKEHIDQSISNGVTSIKETENEIETLVKKVAEVRGILDDQYRLLFYNILKTVMEDDYYQLLPSTEHATEILKEHKKVYQNRLIYITNNPQVIQPTGERSELAEKIAALDVAISRLE